MIRLMEGGKKNNLETIPKKHKKNHEEKKKGAHFTFPRHLDFPLELRSGDLVTQIFSGRPGPRRMCSENTGDVVEEFSVGQIRGRVGRCRVSENSPATSELQ